MNIILRTGLSAFVIVALSACAVSPDSRSVAAADIESADIADAQTQDRYVTVTGSRIRHRVSDDGGAPLTSLPIVGYSHDDIEFTGVRDMQGALIILDPRID